MWRKFLLVLMLAALSAPSVVSAQTCTFCEEYISDPNHVYHRFNSPFPPPWTNYYDTYAHDDWVLGDCYSHGHIPCGAAFANAEFNRDLQMAWLSGFPGSAVRSILETYPALVRVNGEGTELEVASCDGRMIRIASLSPFVLARAAIPQQPLPVSIRGVIQLP